jgi:RNA polymerase sigma-70 factor, ECF subfamily
MCGRTGPLRRTGRAPATLPRRFGGCSIAAVTGPSVRDPAAAADTALVARLREGDERAFEDAVEILYPAMIATARVYVRSPAVAEDVVQDAWLGIIRGLDRFEGRSSLRTWVLQIVANIARTRAVREARTMPFSSLEPEEWAVEPSRFRGPDNPYPGHWLSYPKGWETLPEHELLSSETLEVVQEAIDELPAPQRAVITLRDVIGCTPEEVCEALGISDGNHRVLLHRARARVRARLEVYLDG